VTSTVTTPPPPSVPPRSREDHLDVALALAEKQVANDPSPQAHVVAHLQVADVAAAAGVSRTALYRLWETQDAFRADLTEFLAAGDDAPWMAPAHQYLEPGLTYPHGFRALTGRVFTMVDQQLATDVRPLIRMGIAGHPREGRANQATALRELWRLDRYGRFLQAVMANTGRRCRPGVTAHDVAAAVANLADGLAFELRLRSGVAPTPGTRPPLPRGLFALGFQALFDGMTEPGTTSRSVPERPVPSPESAVPPVVDVARTRRRRHYLTIAAQLVAQGKGDGAPGCVLGFVDLDVLARGARLSRTAFRRIWPTQAAFGLDLAAHLLRQRRQAVVAALAAGPPPGPLGPGASLARLVLPDPSRIGHLVVAPHLTSAPVAEHLRRAVAPLADDTAGALLPLLASCRQVPVRHCPDHLGVLVHALVDGTTRMARTLSHIGLTPSAARGGTLTLGVALRALLESTDLNTAATD
jgi:AcrR family transcriptional regulator